MADFEVWPGPMEGVMRPEFIRAAERLQLIRCWMTPFLRLSETLPRQKKLREFLAPFAEGKRPVVVQLMGTNGELLGRCGAAFSEWGIREINLNFGCPSRRVVRGGAGGGALRKPDELLHCVELCRKNLPEPMTLSVKMRADAMEYLLPRLGGAGAGKIFFHCRTVAEEYRRIPDRETRFLRAAQLAGSVPLVLNGDISSVTEGTRLVSLCHAAGVMIARAWMHDPYLLRRFDGGEPSPECGRERFRTALREMGIAGGALIETERMICGEDDFSWRRLLPEESR